METIILAGGCFWCTETIFLQLKGVHSVVSGYSGGHIENPTYWQVAEKTSGHAESIQVKFDPNIISLEEILYVFLKLHNPTQLNRQGVDVGPEYRSAIFYFKDSQRKIAEKVIKETQKHYKDKIVTEVAQYKNFYPAEESHREYYLKNKGNIYCTLVIDPKIQKLKKEFRSLLKE